MCGAGFPVVFGVLCFFCVGIGCLFWRYRVCSLVQGLRDRMVRHRHRGALGDLPLWVGRCTSGRLRQGLVPVFLFVSILGFGRSGYLPQGKPRPLHLVRPLVAVCVQPVPSQVVHIASAPAELGCCLAVCGSVGSVPPTL